MKRLLAILLSMGIIATVHAVEPKAERELPSEGAELSLGLDGANAKRFEGCGATVESAEGKTKIVDDRGRAFEFLYDGERLTEFRTPGGTFVVVYDGEKQRPLGYVNMETNKTVPIRPSPGPDFIKAVIAKGTLPTVEKMLGHICGREARAKDWVSSFVVDEDYFVMMSEEYWDMTLSAAQDGWFDIWANQKPPICDPQAECLDQCVQEDIFNLLGCVVVTGAFAIFGMPEVGVVAGVSCALIQRGGIYPRCQNRCRTRFPCY